jgi:HK97 family phage major capsid protein
MDGFRKFSVVAKAKTAEIYLYDEIGSSFWGEGITSKQLADQLAAIDKVDSILLRINSPGGDVFEGAAMYDLIAQNKIPVNVRVDGLAASAAFTVAMAGKTIEIGEAGMMMLHNARGMAFGTAKDMQDTGNILDKVSMQMAELYAKRCNKSVADVKAMMDKESWLTPQECVDAGFAESIISKSDGEDQTLAVAAHFDLEKVYQHVPPSLRHKVAIAASAKFAGPVPEKTAKAEIKEEKKMITESAAPAASAAVEVKESYGKTAAEIMKLGESYGVDVSDYVGRECTLGEAKEIVADMVLARAKKSGNSSGLAAPTVESLTPKERREYSVRRAILSMADKTVDAKFEQDISDDIAKSIGRASRGIYIPTRLQPMATGLDTKTGSGSDAKYTVATEVRDLIELLRNSTKVINPLGATVLAGLSSNIQFPRQLTGSYGSWVLENPGSDVTQHDATFGVLSLTPKTYQATTAFSRQLLAQNTIDIENFVRGDLATAHALALDLAAIDGLGSANQPKGVLRTTGIGSVTMGASGGVPTYAKVVELETNVATANADEAGMKFLTTPGIRGVLKSVAVVNATYGTTPLWGQMGNAPGAGEMIGYPAYVSNQVPSTKDSTDASVHVCHCIILGSWPSLLIGEWGVLDLVVDPYALKKQGMIEVTSFQMVDVGVRQPANFAAIQDAKLS